MKLRGTDIGLVLVAFMAAVVSYFFGVGYPRILTNVVAALIFQLALDALSERFKNENGKVEFASWKSNAFLSISHAMIYTFALDFFVGVNLNDFGSDYLTLMFFALFALMFIMNFFVGKRQSK